MQLKVSKPHDDWTQFPRSNIPITPIVDCSFLWGCFSDTNKCNNPFIHNKTVYVHGGRYAISLALDIMGIDSRCSVLVPSYHCISMISPIVWSGADIAFYKINRDLSPDIEDIERQISRETKAIIIVHFFGFPQNSSKISRICKKRNIVLIEDCAHAFLGKHELKNIGTTGDFAIASLKKFFPVIDGGVLLINCSKVPELDQTHLRISEQLKHIVNTLEQSLYFRSSKFLKVWKLLLNYPTLKRESINYKNLSYNSNNVSDILKISSWFEPSKKVKRISGVSKFIVERSKTSYICNRRRQNYFYLLEGCMQSKAVAPLFGSLPSEVVPYMFPLILNNPDVDFGKLKKKKIPIWRWEELCLTDCEISRYFSKHLIQLPCHQSLKKFEMDAIIQAVNEL